MIAVYTERDMLQPTSLIGGDNERRNESKRRERQTQGWFFVFILLRIIASLFLLVQGPTRSFIFIIVQIVTICFNDHYPLNY